MASETQTSLPLLWRRHRPSRVKGPGHKLRLSREGWLCAQGVAEPSGGILEITLHQGFSWGVTHRSRHRAFGLLNTEILPRSFLNNRCWEAPGILLLPSPCPQDHPSRPPRGPATKGGLQPSGAPLRPAPVRVPVCLQLAALLDIVNITLQGTLSLASKCSIHGNFFHCY